VTYTDRTIEVPGLATLWRLGADAAATVEARSQALAALPQSATPDYCEMNVVANSTGLGPACDAMSYPLCRISELADIFVPKEEGGILERTGVVDVFNCLRREDEASFGGGVFVIVRCTDAEVWETLRQKGHVVSRNGRHACIYLPYHLMGLETPISLFTAVLLKQPSGAATQAAHAVMAARTTRAFNAGEKLAMGGHHHVIEGVEPRLLPGNRESFGLAPFYLAANKALTRDVPAGALITPDMLDLAGSDLAAAWQGTLACSTALRNA
jgi:predicted homoserine dehydrogenase-like protein